MPPSKGPDLLLGNLFPTTEALREDSEKDSQIDEQAVKSLPTAFRAGSLQQKDPELGKRRFKGAVVCSDLTLCAVVVAGDQPAATADDGPVRGPAGLAALETHAAYNSQGPSFKSLEMCSQMPQFLFRTTFEDPFQLQIGD